MPVIDAIGGTRLIQQADASYLLDNGASAVVLGFGGGAVLAGGFGSWAPLGAEAVSGGYLVAWRNGGADQFLLWQVDATGAWQGSGAGVLSGGQYALQAAEATLGQDLNGDGTVGPVLATLEAVGATRLVTEADEYFLLPVGGGVGPALSFGGNAVLVGGFGPWAPLGAEAVSGGYLAAWRNGGADQYLLWQVDATGAWQGSGAGVLSGGQYALQTAEATLGQDLNGDGTVGPVLATLEAVGAARLVTEADQYFLLPAGGGAGPALSFNGSAVLVGGFGPWAPLGAEAVSGGYLVAWRNGGSGPFLLWQVDSTGAWQGSGVGVLSGGQYALQAAESTLGQDLNGDGTIGPVLTVLEGVGATRLVTEADQYFLLPAAGASGPALSFNGSAVLVGGFGPWAPLGAEAVSGGYLAAWRNGGADQYLLWQVDATGAWQGSGAGVLSGGQYALQAAEATLGQDLNGDGTIGPVLATLEGVGAARLVTEADQYFLLPAASGTGPALSFNGSAVLVGGFGPWAPLGAEAVSGGYLVAWRNGGADQYVLWRVDAAGAWQGSGAGLLGGGQYALQAAEATLGQDLNGDGTIGPVLTVLESAGATRLATEADEYFLLGLGGTGPALGFGGSTVIVGGFGSWAPVGAEAVSGGYLVAWRNGGADQYLLWQVDATGAWQGSGAGVLSGGQYALQAAEATLGQDLNGDGTIGPVLTVLEGAGATRLVTEADQYFLLPAGGGTGPALSFNGSAVLVGGFGPWAPVGAEAVSGGYLVAWRNGGTGPFLLWRVDATGAWQGSGAGLLGGGQYALQAAEATLGQDLNGDGTVGLALTTLESAGATRLLREADEYFLLAAGGSGPALSFGGTTVVAGAFGGWVPVAGEAVGGGYLVAWHDTASGLYLVWNLDAGGAFSGLAQPATGGGNYQFQAIEIPLQQDVNGDGVTGIGIAAFNDTAANLLAYLAPLAADPNLTSIRLSDTATLALPWASFASYQATLDKLVAGQAMVVAGVPVGGAATAQADSHVASFAVADTAAQVLGGLAALNADTRLASVALTDSASLGLSYAQYAANPSLVGKLGAGVAHVGGVAAANALAVSADGHVGQLAVSDTLANIGSSLDALEAAARTGKLGVIAVGDVGQTLTVSKAQAAADADALALLSGSYALRVLNFQINLHYDASMAGAPQAMKDALAYAVMYFEGLITDDLTVDLNVGYREVGGQALGTGTLGAALDNSGVFVSYATLKAALLAKGSSADQLSAYGALGGDFSLGATFYVPMAEARVLHLGGTSTGYDGSIGFGPDLTVSGTGVRYAYDPNHRAVAGAYDFIGVAEHEISHALGRVGELWAGTAFQYTAFTALDLFRFQAPGVHSVPFTTAGYFSVDNGVHNLNTFSTSSDLGDWANSAGFDANDAFASPGVVNPFTAVDVREMNVLGFAL